MTYSTKKILSDVCLHVNVHNIQALAKFYEISANTLYGWIRRNKIADVGIILAKNPEINSVWLTTGQGEMVQKEKGKAQVSFSPEKRMDFSHENEGFTMKEMVSMTMDILESDTVYRSALASNIRAFHSAVETENDMQEIKQKMEEMTETMKKMEEMLLSFGATLPQKRDQAANS